MRIPSVVSFLGLSVLVAWLPPATRADEWNKETRITFSQPVEVPGKVLPAGTYVFELAESSSDRDIVEIFNEDRTELFATIIGIGAYRAEPADKVEVTFEKRADAAPQAIKDWFYPGDTDGIEFVYPAVKHRDVELSAATLKQSAPEV